jgi:hypothetical protein
MLCQTDVLLNYHLQCIHACALQQQALLLTLGKFTAVAGLAYVLVGKAVAFARTRAHTKKQQNTSDSGSPTADVSATSAAHHKQHIPVSEPGVVMPGLTKGRNPEVQLQEQEEERAGAEHSEVGRRENFLCTELFAVYNSIVAVLLSQ